MRCLGGPRLLAVSDLHVEVPENRQVVTSLHPGDDDDWLILSGDVGELMADIAWCLRFLAQRFARVLWVPGNHELWTRPDDPVQLRGRDRYRSIVDLCRELGILTPEDDYPVWDHPGGQVVLAPLFVPYDYSYAEFLGGSKEEALAGAHRVGVVSSDEVVLFTDPYSGIEDWCRDRVAFSEAKLSAATATLPSILINHFPLRRELTTRLLHPEFGLWCGTLRTEDWHRRFGAIAAVYGHLHIPGTTVSDGVRFEEVSMGYPREWHRRQGRSTYLRQVLPYGDIRA
jgi:Calcineurin-like phosphoesterase